MAPGLSFNLLSVVIVTKSGSACFQRAKRDGLVGTAGHDVLGKFAGCFSRGPRGGTLNHQALRPVTADLALLGQEDALRHEWVGVALRYQRDFRAHD